MIELASIQLNAVTSGNDVVVFVRDILLVEQRTGTAADGAKITFRDGRTLLVTETVTAVQTAVNALWDEYMTALGNPA